jgi:hypothetical protein
MRLPCLELVYKENLKRFELFALIGFKPVIAHQEQFLKNPETPVVSG